MKNILFFILNCFLLGSIWSGCGALGKAKLTGTEKPQVVPLDSFLIEMDEYIVVDSGFMNILDSLISYGEKNKVVMDKAEYTPIFISVGSVQRKEYLLFEFGLTRAYLLEFPTPGYDSDVFVFVNGFGVVSYRGYLVKLSGLLETYSFTDEKGGTKYLIKPTGKKHRFYTFLRQAEDGTGIIDFRGREDFYYQFKHGFFVAHTTTKE